MMCARKIGIFHLNKRVSSLVGSGMPQEGS